MNIGLKSISNSIIIRERSIIFYKTSLKKVFSNWFFIYFSFVNLFLPFFTTMISALKGPHATLNITAIGLSTSFVGIFNQLLFLISISLFFVFNRNKKATSQELINKHTIPFIMLIYSVCIAILFIATSLLYIKSSVLYIGYNVSFLYAVQFILIISPTFIINSYIYLVIAYKLNYCKWQSIIIYTIYFILNFILIPLFYLVIDWGFDYQLVGIGLGILLASILTLIIVLIINWNSINIKTVLIPNFNKESFKFFFQRTSNFIFNFILSTILKCFLLLILGLAMKSYDKSTFTSLMLAKIIWYHSLYFCGFFADGILYAIEYTKMQNYAEKNGSHKESIGLWILLTTIAVLGTLVVNIVFNVIATNGLSYLYSMNQLKPIGNIPSEIISRPNGTIINNFLWSTDNVNLQLITNKMTPCYSLMYLTIYHLFINATKIISTKPIKVDQKFNWKSLFSNFILLIFVMAFISIMGCAFNDKKFAGYLNTFNGLDSFSFSLMLVSIILNILTTLGFVKWAKQKSSRALK